jgi:hypothetical protein
MTDEMKSKVESLLEQYKIKFNRNEVLGGIKFDYYVPSKLMCIDFGEEKNKKYDYCTNNGMGIIQLDPKCKNTNIESILIMNCVKKRKPRSGRDASKFYWREDKIADAILRYKNSDDQEERNKIYEEELHKSFSKLVENVFNTFKFSYFDSGPEDAMKECLTHLVSNIHKFDPNRISEKTGQVSKSFSYFSIIAKHNLIARNNKNYERFGSQVSLDVSWGDGGGENGYTHDVPVQLMVESETEKYNHLELNKILVHYLEQNINEILSKQSDLNIANAIIEIFRNSDRIDVYNKKALYLYVREMAMCKTQQISKIINKLKPHIDKVIANYNLGGNAISSIYDLPMIDKSKERKIRERTSHSKFSKVCKYCKKTIYYKTQIGLDYSIKHKCRCRSCWR